MCIHCVLNRKAGEAAISSARTTTLHMLRTINCITNTIGYLPKDVFMNLRLVYNEQGTHIT